MSISPTSSCPNLLIWQRNNPPTSLPARFARCGKANPAHHRQDAMNRPHIRLRNVGKTYQTKDGLIEACADVTIDIGQSEFVAIVGPSGCGKTTILKMVAG